MKEGMSGFDIAAMVNELQSLIGGRIDKAFQLARGKLLLRLRVPEMGRKNLVVVVGKWIYLSTQSQETPKTPPSFAMLLRKHLNNGKITKIEQHGFDRIIVFHIQKGDNYQLIFEMFREGNVVLVQEGSIIQPLIPKSWSRREVRAKREYVFPPSRVDFYTLDKDGFEDILKSSKKDLVRTLAMDVNLGGIYAEEVCLLSEIEKGRKANGLSEDEIERIFKNVRQLYHSLKEAKGGFLILEDSTPKDITPFPLKIYEDYRQEEFSELSMAIEKYLESGEKEEPLEVEYEDIKARYERQLAQQREAIANLEKRADESKRKAELIYVNYQECEKLLSTINATLKEKVMTELITELQKYPSFIKLEPEKSEVVLSLKDEEGGTTNISLNFRISVEENAGMFYDKAKKAKEKLEGAKKSLEETEQKIKRADVEKEKKIKKEKRKTKQFWFEKYRWFFSSDGNIVIAGRDAKTNDKVVKKYLSDRDRYAHAEIHGAPSVVIKNNDGEFSDRTLKEACEYALCFSKAWNAQIGAGTAYWVLPDQVSKTPPTGEFLPRGAFIIRGRKNIISNIEVKLAVGKMNYEGVEKVMCAPESAVITHCESYIVFAPGEMKKSDFSGRLREIFDVEQEEISRVLPPGDVKVLKMVGISEEMF
ncbi:MAG: NFACT family protein [Thermoplasmata archaeon]|nr:MAG: NFACT family protein [Thermoplasmata archaeon]